MDNYDLQVDIAKGIFLKYDQKYLIDKFRLEADENYIYMTYLNRPCSISRQSGSIAEQVGNVWQECRNFSTVMTIYDLLCHHKGKTAPVLFNRWCTVGNFVVTGVTQTEGFTRRYAKDFDGRLEMLKTACEKLGGVLQKPLAGADLTCRFAVTPFFPVLLQFWEGDEEFPPKLTLLWDSNTMAFMHFETTFYLQGDLLGRLKGAMEVFL